MHVLGTHSHPPVVQLGWTSEQLRLVIPAGVASPLGIRRRIEKAGGYPLDSYDGWTFRLQFFQYRVPIIDAVIVGLVTGDDDTRTLTAEVDFTSEFTSSLPKGRITAILEFISVDQAQRVIDFEVEVT